MSAISEEEKLRRRQVNDSVIGTTVMSGVTPDAVTLSLLDRFAEGQFTRDELSDALDAHAHKLLREIHSRQQPAAE